MHEQTKQAVWQTILTLNRLWTVDGKPEQLADYFHADMVAVTATDRLRLEGQEACVAAWKAFVDTTTIHHWHEEEPLITLFHDGRCAVATYYFDMSFDMHGRTLAMAGRDMMTLVEEDGRWWVVADQFSPYPVA